MFTFKSTVIPGEKLGREIGFPTLNLVIPPEFDLAHGIYACRVTFPALGASPALRGERFVGGLHFGPKFSRISDQEKVSLEVHLLNFTSENPFSADELVEVEIVTKLREVQHFETAEALKAQIAQDIERIRQMEL